MNTETKGHVHAELIAQYAEDARTNAEPWRLWEYGDDEVWWHPCSCPPGWVPSFKYRRKPRTININGHEVPEPLREVGGLVEVWVADITIESKCTRARATAAWPFERGIAHATREAALAHANALLSFTAEAK